MSLDCPSPPVCSPLLSPRFVPLSPSDIPSRLSSLCTPIRPKSSVIPVSPLSRCSCRPPSLPQAPVRCLAPTRLLYVLPLFRFCGHGFASTAFRLSPPPLALSSRTQIRSIQENTLETRQGPSVRILVLSYRAMECRSAVQEIL